MIETTHTVPARVIVIPRQLEGFFYERLTRHFAQDDGVRIVVDRRVAERRDEDEARHRRAQSERRRRQRRRIPAAWTLSNMPTALS